MQRWMVFARTLRARHARIARRHHFQAMTLVRPRSAGGTVSSFRNQTQFAVHLHLPGETTRTIHDRFHTIRRDLVYRERMLIAPRTENEKPLVRVRPVKSAASPAAGHAVLPEPAPRWERRFIRQTILQGLIERNRRVGDFIVRLREIAPAARKATLAAERVVRSAARHEERAGYVAMPLRPQTTALVPEVREQESVPGASPAPATFAAETGRAPEVNLDALTTQVMDQIDRRVVAWRERMGRF